jgi:hypothetical protein
MRIFPCLALLLAASAGLAYGQAYPIKLKTHPDKGQTLLCRETEKNTTVLRFFDDRGKQLQDQKQVEESEEVYLLTVLVPGAKFPLRYAQTFDKAMHGNGVRSQPKSYQGHKLEFDWQDGKYQLKLGQRADLSDEEKQALVDRANNEVEAPLDTMFTPTEPVELRELWAVNPTLLQKAFGRLGKLDGAKTRGRGRLTRVYRKGGALCGVIEVQLTIAFQEMANLKFDSPALWDIKVSLDTAIDGSTNVGTLTTVSKLTGKGHVVEEKTTRPLELLRESSVKKERSLPES